MEILNEKLGIPNTILNIINENRENILIYSKELKDLFIKIDYSDLKTSINLKFIKKNSYSSYIKYNEYINNNFNFCEIGIGIPESPTSELIFKSISHELLHAYELYQLKDKLKYTKWNRTDALNRISIDGDLNVPYILYLKDLFYLALPHEIRARTASIYLQLLDVNRSDILNKLKKTREWEFYNSLVNFNSIKIYNILIEKEDFDKVVSNIKLFNKNLDLEFKIDTKNDLKVYLQRLEKYFKMVAQKHKRKLLKIAGSIINESELKLNWIASDPVIKTYEEYEEEYDMIIYNDLDYKKIIGENKK